MTANHVEALAVLGDGAAAAIGRHMDRAFRAFVGGAPHVADARTLRLVTGEPHPFGNFALVAAPVDVETTRALVEPLVAGATPAAVIFPDLDVPAEVDAWLAGQGFMPPAAMPAMGVDIARLAPTALPTGYEFARIGAADGDEWTRQFAAGYELPLGVAACFSPAAIDADTSPEASMQFFAIRRDGAIVATSAMFFADGLAGIYCVSTVPEERRKGLGAHATAEPLRHAASLGYRVGVLQSSAAGHGVYRNLGFGDFGGVPLYVRIPA